VWLNDLGDQLPGDKQDGWDGGEVEENPADCFPPDNSPPDVGLAG
jgi:hypothetical protein